MHGGSGQQHLPTPDPTPARCHLPGDPGTRRRDGNCPARQNFLPAMPQPMCRGRMGSAAPLGSSAAFWEHHSPGLGGFFWKMSPACDESAVAVCSLPSAPCGAWGCPQGHSRCSLHSDHPGDTRGCAGSAGQELSRGLGLPGPRLASRSRGDRRTHGCCSCHPRQRHLQPAAKAVHPNDSRWKGRGWESAGRALEAALQAGMCGRCPGVLEGMVQLRIKQKRHRLLMDHPPCLQDRVFV